MDDIDRVTVENIEELRNYFYDKYYIPFLKIDDKLSLLDKPRCQSKDFLNRFSNTVPPDSELHVFSFNVGQGNCIILRHGRESAIIDAGRGAGMDKALFENFIQPKIISLLQGTSLKAVFVTHPHTDHYNLISDLIQDKTVDKTQCKVFLGGTQRDYNSGNEVRTFWNSIKDYPNLFFVADKVCDQSGGTISPPIMKNIFDGTVFQFILPLQIWKRADNTCSFFLKVYHGSVDRSFLFTGDAEGVNLDKITGHVYKEDHSKLLWGAIAPEFKSYIQKPIFTPDQQSEMSLYKENREALQNMGVVFSPHHGTDTKGSQNVMIRLLTLKKPAAAFVINSVVTQKDKNPPESTIRLVDKVFVKHMPHAITFYKGEQMDYKFTTRRIYTTEAAPGGVYWFMSNNDGVFFYNAFPKDDSREDIGFLPIK